MSSAVGELVNRERSLGNKALFSFKAHNGQTMFKSLIGNFWNTIDACRGVPVDGTFNQSVAVIGDTYEHTSIEHTNFSDDCFISEASSCGIDTGSIGFD